MGKAELHEYFFFTSVKLSDSNKIRLHNHLVCKRTLNFSAKLDKWLICVLSTYLYGTSDYVIDMSRTSFKMNLPSKRVQGMTT